MKYIVLTTKHHDGFCLWDTKLTDYNIMNSPFQRDVVKELADACKKQGIAFGTYYSVCDWHHPDFPLTSPGGKTKREKSDLDAYNRYLLGQIKELITNYGPLLTIWNDVPQMFEGRGVEHDQAGPHAAAGHPHQQPHRRRRRLRHARTRDRRLSTWIAPGNRA